MRKVFVPVVVRIDEMGNKRPQIIEFEGQKYRVDRVKHCDCAACQSVGGVGIRYDVVVLGKDTELWEEKGQWFVVAKDAPIMPT